MLIFSPARRVRDNTTKHTLGNVMEVPEVVVNVVSHSIVHQMNLASTEYPDGVNEFIKSGLTALPSDIVRPYRVAEAPVQMECKVREIKPLGNQGGAGQLIFAEVVKMHINRSILNEDESINPHKIDLVARMGGNLYCRASQEAVFEVEKPLDIPGMGIDALPPHIRFSQVLTGNDLGMLGNMASLPTQHEIQDWMRANPDLKAAANKHEIAQTFIRQGKKTDALMLLLSEA